MSHRLIFIKKLRETEKKYPRTFAKIKKNPVREGARARRQAKKNERERRNQFFHEQAVQKAIERRIARENRD